MKLYVIRHGETKYNIQNRICGITDLELTDKGKQQALNASKHFENIKIDRIYVSPLKRAQETAAIINKVTNTDIEVDNRLREINYGTFEGKKGTNRSFNHVKKNLGMNYPEGESFLNVTTRVYTLIEELINSHPNETILLVCHGGIMRVIETYFTDMTNKEIYKYAAKNCQINTYEINVK
ncbi:MAG: histidine phosphatase family protein [Thomasclavelia sp.]|jgi:broad specificity phosphatase PhoE|nr:histidine phosphatase family protein [Thomasclavelia sp.]